MLEAKYKVKGNILLVRLKGELDHHEADLVRSNWQDKFYKNKVKHMVVNLEGLTFMDSSGLGVILGRYKEVLQVGGRMIVCNVPESIKRLFEISGLFKIVQLEETENRALTALGVAS